MNTPAATRPEAALMTKAEFIGELRTALDERRGFACGKLGQTERALCRAPLVLAAERDPRRRGAFELSLAHRALRHAGVFPADPAFLGVFCAALCEALRALDCVGVFPEALSADAELLRHHGSAARPIAFIDQEPDRSVPSDEASCYLPLFAGRRVLLVCPFAGFLRSRATRPIFEAVWATSGKRWFEPATVEAVEFPYGFAASTWERYATALELLDAIRTRVAAAEFEVALIAAGALGIPLAAAIKAQGRIAISLGGHLQILFGVGGARWRDRASWRSKYFNDAWVELPDAYRPDPSEVDENYW